MSKEIFEILFRKWYDNNVYRATVEVTYKTENVVRFKISAGNKNLYMEKHLFKKKGQWKITRVDFQYQSNAKEIAVIIANIQDAIDLQMKKIYG